MNLLLIAVGGALGSVFRYISVEAVVKFLRGTNYAIFPFSTLLVNVLGSMLAGICYYFMISNLQNFDDKIRSLIFVGFLGGYTTFSAFSLDFFRLFISGNEFLAFIYALSSVLLAILALFFGFYLMKIIFA